MYYAGIDIGSTCAKLVLLNEKEIIAYRLVLPTGFSSVDTAEKIKEVIDRQTAGEKTIVVATGYGRISVPYADKTLTEITCHARGAAWLTGLSDMTVIDIGGQDTKIILVKDGMVTDFVMNDKCSAGTGRFLEVMANAMALRPREVCELARLGSNTRISSMCTVFAESEVISLIGRGETRENIAYAIVSSIAEKVVSQCGRLDLEDQPVFLTGGLCECAFLKEMTGNLLHKTVASMPDGRYAGAIGAALTGMQMGKGVR